MSAAVDPSRPWKARQIDSAAVDRLAAELSVPPVLARLLVARNVTEAEPAARFLQPQLSHMPDPFRMADLARASERLARAILQGERVALYGDYDVDGVTSSALLTLFLRHHGVEARPYIPHRLREGYGLNRDAIEQLASEATQLLVTLDCGITAADEIEQANLRGMEVIVVDHHRCPERLPPAYATLNPHQAHCDYPDKVLAAVGVAFNLVVGVRRHLRDGGHYPGRWKEPNLRELLDLVALGTIADMVPLTGVNRLLTWFGLREMRAVRRPGLRTLMEVAGVRPARVGGQDVAFRLGPRINAAGRLDDARVGVQLLCAETSEVARPLAERLDVANQDRRRIEAEVFGEAVERVEASTHEAPILVVDGPEWHPGVVGIVASKLVERFCRPAVVIGEGGRGSARTYGDLHLYDALARCSGHLTKFGGHRAAAGLRIPTPAIPAFRSDLEDTIRQMTQDLDLSPRPLTYDVDLSQSDVDLGLMAMVQQLEPFGIGNPEPLFRLSQLPVETTRVVGGHHLKLKVGRGRPLDAIAFRQAELQERLEPGAPIDLACHLDINEFAGFRKVELRVRSLEPSAASLPDRQVA